MINEIVLNLEMVGIGAGLFLGAYLSNVILGTWRSVQIDGCDFDWRRITGSAVKFAVLGIGIALLSIVISTIPYYMSFVGIEIAAETMQAVDAFVIIGSFLTASIRYATDALSKLREILGV